MTLDEWLAARTPPPPAELASRVRDALGDAVAQPAAEASRLCLDAAERVLVRVVERDARARDTAFELLCVDALVTYAFEAAADDPSSLEERASDAMRRLGAFADTRA